MRILAHGKTSFGLSKLFKKPQSRLSNELNFPLPLALYPLHGLTNFIIGRDPEDPSGAVVINPKNSVHCAILSLIDGIWHIRNGSAESPENRMRDRSDTEISVYKGWRHQAEMSHVQVVKMIRLRLGMEESIPLNHGHQILIGRQIISFRLSPKTPDSKTPSVLTAEEMQQKRAVKAMNSLLTDLQRASNSTWLNSFYGTERAVTSLEAALPHLPPAHRVKIFSTWIGLIFQGGSVHFTGLSFNALRRTLHLLHPTEREKLLSPLYRAALAKQTYKALRAFFLLDVLISQLELTKRLEACSRAVEILLQQRALFDELERSTLDQCRLLKELFCFALDHEQIHRKQSSAKEIFKAFSEHMKPKDLSNFYPMHALSQAYSHMEFLGHATNRHNIRNAPDWLQAYLFNTREIDAYLRDAQLYSYEIGTNGIEDMLRRTARRFYPGDI